MIIVKQVKRAILEIIETHPGIDETRIIVELGKINSEYLKIAKATIIKIMDELIGDGRVELVDYRLPKKEKIISLYFPKGTEFTIW